MYKQLLLAFIFSGFVASAQDVQIKKDQVFLDGKVFLKYEKINLSEYSIKDLNGDEILFYQIKNDDFGNTYLVFNFVRLKRKVKSDSVGRISAMGAKNMVEKMIAWLVKDKVFNYDGSINTEALEIFSDKYNDHKDKD